ncbi:hypothetical protein A0H81_09375 [Grifola frondosa]|uniref:Protein kinase domain-containing protein n=1 Tax=Grifola frondosa TaxID=5627 RepID=A0A1C7M2Q9_GRIFR|nr:hypothetical protein A0H81_09375 [Grifola frondosa]
MTLTLLLSGRQSNVSDNCSRFVYTTMRSPPQLRFDAGRTIHASHRVAHRDIMDLNVMMKPEPISSEMYNPVFDGKSYDLSRPIKTTWAIPYKEASSSCFKFLRPLVDDMVQDDPIKRPTIDETVTRFNEICSSLSTWKLRSRVVDRKDHGLLSIPRFFRHVYRTVGYIATRPPAVPTA